MNKYLKFTQSIFLLFIFNLSFAEKGTLKGIITDATTKENLIGVNITTKDGQGAVTDTGGFYSFALEEGKYKITVGYVGYKEIQKDIEIKAGVNNELNFSLETDAKNVIGDELVITGSLFEKKASEEVISISVITPKTINNTNSTRIDEVIRKVSGINVADGQANIRAGSGWAYGVGSRVMVIVDGQSVLSPDRGDVKWTMLPTESVGQIEVLKGASSVLYGSSAMNGTISLQTMKPLAKPVTKLTTFFGFITSPKDKITKWWEFPLPSFGASFARAHKVSNTFEYVVGGNIYFSNLQYQDAQEYMARVNFRTKWTAKRNDRLSFGVAGNLGYNRESEVFYWHDDSTGRLRSGDGATNYFQNIRISIDPYFVYFDKKGNKHDLKTRTYFNKPSFNTKTLLENIDYQFTKHWQWKKANLNWITGVDNQFLWIDVPAFVQGGRKTGNLFAIFTQLDSKIAERVTLSGGIRWEVYKFGSVSGVTLPNGRFGINYEARKNTFIRFNIGQAFRFPSFAERFANESVGNGTLKVFPNIELKPEYGWTSEIGIQQKIRSKRPNLYNGVFDFAFYWQEYHNMVEYTQYNFDTTGATEIVKLRPENISRARVAGWDLSFKNDFNFGTKHNLNFTFGYTYALPADLNPNNSKDLIKPKDYLKELFKSAFKYSNNSITDYILKYRNRHLVTFDAEYSFNNLVSFGIDGRYYSKVENIDQIFFFIPGSNIKDYFDRTIVPKHGDWVINMRASYIIRKHHTFSVILKNAFNREYWLRAGRLESPRNISIQYRLEF